MEIERKWMTEGWPQAELKLLKTEFMRQGYLHAEPPVVRIRQESLSGGDTEYILCIKSAGRLSREEIEISIPKDQFGALEKMTGYPLIEKERRTYQLPDGLWLEVNHVDQGLKTEFWYAEIEYDSEEQAVNWKPESCGLGEYLSDDVTMQSGQSMAQYWLDTRVNRA